MELKKETNKDLESLEWLLETPDNKRVQEHRGQHYGDVSELNTQRTILDTVGKETLRKIAEDSIDLLDSSVAVYEKNGDYAMGIFTSGWCSLMDSTSRRLCGGCSNEEALESGKWICHDFCWDISKRALESGKILDEPCEGGINLYAIPIFAGDEKIGVLSVGYGNPPKDKQKLTELSLKYGLSIDELLSKSEAYNYRPPYLLNIAKKRMRTSAEMIGLIVKDKLDEKALRTAQKSYNLAIEGSGLATWSWNVQTGQVLINDKWASMIGYTRNELEPVTIKTWEKLTHPDDLKKATRLLQSHFKDEQKKYHCELRMKHKNGNWIWMLDRGRVFETTPDGKPLMMFGTHQDITKTKEYQEELERFFSVNLDLLTIADTKGNFVKVNKAWETILGYSVEEIQKRNFLDFVHPDDIEKTLDAVSKLNEQENVTNFVNRYKTKNGDYRHIEWRAQPYDNMIYAAARDITERIETEEFLRESREKYKLMFKYSPVGIINFDKEGVILNANDSFAAIIGSPKRELIGLKMLELPDKKLVAALKKTLKGTQSYYNDEYHATTSGKKIQVKVIFTSIKDDNGDFVLGIGIIEDFSEQRKAERAIIRAKEEAQAANRAKSDFLSSMSHEIRTPLNGVIGFSELLKSTPLNENQKEYNDIVIHSAKSLLGIINDILDFSKIEAGKLDLNNEKTDLFEIIDSTLSILNYKALEKNIELVQNISRNVPRYVYSDPIRLKQILLNLLSNAVKFTNEGEVELNIRKKKGHKEENTVCLSFAVKDTGIGIKTEQLEKILEPFSQGGNMITNKYGGTGLGLSITKSLLGKMESVLKIESVEGKGSTFSFELELEYDDSSYTKKVDSIKKETEESLSSLSDEKTVLIVEDNKVNMQYLEAVLKGQNNNLKIILAYDGEQAIELFKAKKPDFVFMDIQLPKMNGYQVAKELRKIDKKVPIVAITARALKGEREKCLEWGMNDYLLKPVSIKSIKEIMSTYLNE